MKIPLTAQGGKRQNRKLLEQGLTLTEVLVVIAIVTLLAAVALPAYRKARTRGLTVATMTLIHSVEAALSMYATDFGDYPFYSGKETKVLVKLLQGPVESRLWKGPYMRFKVKDIDREKNIIDAWRMPLFYDYPQDKRENVPCIIISAGPDRKMETGDDITNW